MIAIGDSHGLAYMRVLQQFAADTDRVVRLYHRTGCPLVNMRAPVDEARCGRYNAALDRMLLSETQRGDVVFLASVKMPTDLADDGLPKTESAADRNKRLSNMVRATEGLSALSRALETRGVTVVVEGPKPVFRSSTIMCSDWFNRRNPMCRPGFSVQRAEMEVYRGPTVRRIAEIARARPNVLLWDPFPLLCPRQVCHAYLRGKPLFIDGHHLSAYANDLLYPSFRRAMQTAFGRTLPQTPRPVNHEPSRAPKTVLARTTPE